VSSSVTADLWETIAADAARESSLWTDALRPQVEREHVAVFSPLGEVRYALGLETIYEGYLLHYGRSRLFAPNDADTALLLGDYLYAHGLVRIAAHDEVGAVEDLAELISVSAQVRADGDGDDGPLWAATAALLGRGELAEARASLRLRRDARSLAEVAIRTAGADAVERALAAHAERLR
jgi:hypothetical protein